MATSHTSKKSEKTSKEHLGLMELFENQLKDIYWVEEALLKVIPKMIKSTTHDELVDILESHHSETEKQVKRLEKVFSVIDLKAKAVKCEGITGIIKENDELIKDLPKGSIRDAGIILGAQKIEHYEIATYGTLSALAKTLCLENKVIDLLEESLEEEKNADIRLSEVAENLINAEAYEEEAR